MLQAEEIKFIQENLRQDTSRIALSAGKFPNLDIKKLTAQIQARQKLTEKLPQWTRNEAIFFPQQLSLEQASSEVTANFKASLVSGNLIDLTGGMGIDTWAFAQRCDKVTYVEQEAELTQQAIYNHQVLGLRNVTHIHGNGIDQLDKIYDWVYIDPARRDQQGNKVILFKDCQPNVLELLDKVKTSKLLIKTSPVLDISRAIQELGGVEKVYVVAYQQEVKELLFIKSGQSSLDPEIEMVELANTPTTLYRGKLSEERAAKMHIEKVGAYIYEAHPALLKAGFFKSIQSEGIWQLGRNTHLYSSELFIEAFPGKKYVFIASGPVQPHWLKQHLTDLRVSITTKNFPLKPQELRSKLKLKDGGEYTLFAIHNSAEKNELILCKKCL